MVTEEREERIPLKDLWNGMFDFNGDGRMDIGEEFDEMESWDEEEGW